MNKLERLEKENAQLKLKVKELMEVQKDLPVGKRYELSIAYTVGKLELRNCTQKIIPIVFEDKSLQKFGEGIINIEIKYSKNFSVKDEVFIACYEKKDFGIHTTGIVQNFNKCKYYLVGDFKQALIFKNNDLLQIHNKLFKENKKIEGIKILDNRNSETNPFLGYTINKKILNLVTATEDTDLNITTLKCDDIPSNKICLQSNKIVCLKDIYYVYDMKDDYLIDKCSKKNEVIKLQELLNRSGIDNQIKADRKRIQNLADTIWNKEF